MLISRTLDCFEFLRFATISDDSGDVIWLKGLKLRDHCQRLGIDLDLSLIVKYNMDEAEIIYKL